VSHIALYFELACIHNTRGFCCDNSIYAPVCLEQVHAFYPIFIAPLPPHLLFSMGTWYFFVNAAKKKNTPFTIKEEERGARG
jgi:hypothetical protein